MIPQDAARLHEPVLLNEVLDWLAPCSGGVYCDATVGLGGHARTILERSAPGGTLVGLDRDPSAVRAASEALADFGKRAVVVHAPFSQVQRVLEELGRVPVDGILADLGVSSPQLDRAERGFSFQQAGPLDMRMDPTSGESAARFLERIDEVELATLIREYGEERYAGRIAREILRARDRGQLATTADLAAVVARAVPGPRGGKHPATRTFQALRIAVNRELEELDTFLDRAVGCLRRGGRLCVISFHSLEDRIVKRRFRALAADRGDQPASLAVLTKRPVTAGEDELHRNPRARSAKLRAAERVH